MADEVSMEESGCTLPMISTNWDSYGPATLLMVTCHHSHFSRGCAKVERRKPSLSVVVVVAGKGFAEW